MAWRERDKSFKKFRVTNLDSDWLDFKQKRNKAVSIIRYERKKYYQENIDLCRGNSKKMWRTLKKLIGNAGSDKKNIDNIKFERDTGCQEENFNNFYADSIKNIAESIEDVNKNFDSVVVDRSDISFPCFKLLSLNKLRKIVMDLKNKSTSDDGLNIKLIKELFDVIGYPLLNLVNTSLSQGCMPSELKVSIIVPVPKVQIPSEPSEYRPINLLPVVEKIIEIAVSEQVREYVELNKIIYSGQNGFRDKHSCESALQFVCGKWRSDIGEGKVTLSVFVDLQRAFETIDRSRLLWKLRKYGIKSTALRWMASYLENRCHKTKVNNKISRSVDSIYGVPQGSVLGPLLFVLYINDISKVLTNSFVSLFADDTLISVSGHDLKEIVQTLNVELDILYDWLCVNKLKLNSTKTKCMLIGSKHNCQKYSENDINVCIKNNKIEVVSEIKYLGVILDQQLTFSRNVDYLCKKIGEKIVFFYRISRNLSEWSKLLIYNTILSPHFNYCISLLISCSNEDISRLQILQNKIMRIILNCDKYTPILTMLKSLRWLSVRQNIDKANVTLIYKIRHKKLPEYLQNFLVTRSEKHRYDIRSKDNYNIEFVRSSKLQKTLFSDGLRLFNALPDDMKDVRSVGLFTKLVTNNLLLD